MDERDRQLLGAGIDGPPGEADVAGVCGVDAGEDLDQRRLPGTVLAEQRMDLAAPQVEVDAVESEGAGEPLGQTGHGEDRALRRSVRLRAFRLGHGIKMTPG